jgi:hypothetical protein
MTNNLIDRALVVADLMKRSAALGIPASVNEDGHVWLHGPDGTPAHKIGTSASEAVRYLKSFGGG